MVANTKKHGKNGVTKDALSARQLVDERLDLSDHSAAAMTGTRDFR